MKRAPFIDMKKRLVEQTLSAEAKENNVPSQKNSSLRPTHQLNSILLLEPLWADRDTDTQSAATVRRARRAKSQCGDKLQRPDK